MSVEENVMIDNDSTRMVAVKIKRLHYVVEHEMVEETVVVEIPDAVPDEAVREFVESHEECGPWAELAQKTTDLVVAYEDLYKVAVFDAGDNCRPHFVLNWDEEGDTLVWDEDNDALVLEQ